MTTEVSFQQCRYCGGMQLAGIHPLERCPAVRAIDYFPDGTVKRLEFNR